MLFVVGLMNYVYKGDYVLLVFVSIFVSVVLGSCLLVMFVVEWFVCIEMICVFECGMLEIVVMVGVGSVDFCFDVWCRYLFVLFGVRVVFVFDVWVLCIGILLFVVVVFEVLYFFFV